MAFAQKWLPCISLTSLLLLLLVTGNANARTQKSKGGSDDDAEEIRLAENHEAHWSKHVVADPDAVASMVAESIINSTSRRRKLNGCGITNPMDACWRCNPNWADERVRQSYADCGMGFGKDAKGGYGGKYYVVTSSGDNDPVNPEPGTLRHAVIQTEPLWIIFKKPMTIRLKEELIMNSYKTIDAREMDVHVVGGGCITVQYITNVIITGLNIHDCVPSGNTNVRSTPDHYGFREMADGDGISIFGSSKIWVDHCTLSQCTDGLIDVVQGSTAITISNNLFHHHNETILLGASDSYVQDKNMQVTVAFNHFGDGLIQRMPRCRHGYFHIVNNAYTKWEMYAIGGSASPFVLSEGNAFTAGLVKDVIHHQDSTVGDWTSSHDLLLNGAVFAQSGGKSPEPTYAKASGMLKAATMVPLLTTDAGAFN